MWEKWRDSHLKIPSNQDYYLLVWIYIKNFSPEKHGGGFFSKAYITYLVTTSPTEYRVRRRYSDFEWLRNILTIIYPGASVSYFYI